MGISSYNADKRRPNHLESQTRTRLDNEKSSSAPRSGSVFLMRNDSILYLAQLHMALRRINVASVLPSKKKTKSEDTGQRSEFSHNSRLPHLVIAATWMTATRVIRGEKK